jgi:hypothetical protein
LRKDKWTALYLPATDRPDPSKYDCATKEEAEQYVLDHMCGTCKEERHRALNGLSDPTNEEHEFDSEYPACTCEWTVLKTRDLKNGMSFTDIMEASGAKVIYRRDA